MKRFALLAALSLLLLTALPSKAYGQKYERSVPDAELNIGYGLFTVGDFAITFGQGLAMVFSLGHYNLKNMYLTGAFSVEGYLKTADWLYVGAIASYERIGGDIYNKSGTVTNADGTKTNQYEYKGKMHYDMLLPMLSLKPFWFNHARVSMYSKLAAGGFFILPGAEGDPSASFGFQVSPVCVEFGRSWRGYAELGFGMQGILNIGVCKRF